MKKKIKLPPEINAYFSKIGRVGGLASSPAKAEAARLNASLPRKKKNREKPA